MKKRNPINLLKSDLRRFAYLNVYCNYVLYIKSAVCTCSTIINIIICNSYLNKSFIKLINSCRGQNSFCAQFLFSKQLLILPIIFPNVDFQMHRFEKKWINWQSLELQRFPCLRSHMRRHSRHRPPPTLSFNDPRLRFSQEFFKVNFLPVWRNAIFIATTSDSIWTLFFLANKQIAKCVAFLPGNSWFYFVCLLSSMISVWWLTHFETCWNNPEFVWIHTYVR